MSAYRESEFLRTTAGTRPDACTRGFLARLHAGLLEVALVTQRLDDALLVEDLLQTLETAFNGFALFQLQLDRHACFTSLSKLSDLRGLRKSSDSISSPPGLRKPDSDKTEITNPGEKHVSARRVAFALFGLYVVPFAVSTHKTLLNI